MGPLHTHTFPQETPPGTLKPPPADTSPSKEWDLGGVIDLVSCVFCFCKKETPQKKSI